MKSILLVGLLASGLMSSEKGLYVGIDAFKTRTNLTVSNSGLSEKQNVVAPSQTLKAGYYLSLNSRVNGFYQHHNTLLEHTNGSLYGLGIDYLIGDNELKPFIGGLVGYSKYSQTDLHLDGSFVGVNLGLNYALGENFSIEAGYRHMISNANGRFTSSTSEANIDTLKNWYIGVNYKFQ